jgi:hypothetical protein
MKKKIMTVICSLFVGCMSIALPVYAQGDPVEEQADGVLPENPGDQAEIDHTPISYDGTGTIVDNITQGSKQFYTISTDAGNVFYLIVDLDKDYNNVYFLDTTKETDLIALAEKAEGNENVQIKEPETPKEAVVPEEPVVEEPPKEEPPAPQKNNSLLITMILIGVVGAGVIFYYWIYKPKKDREEAEELEENFDFHEPESSFDDSFEEEDTYGEGQYE